MTHTYAVQHPNMSEPLVMDSEVERTPRALAAWASMHILREFDVMLPVGEFTVTEVTPAPVECIVDPNVDGPTLWDCPCSECRGLRRHAAMQGESYTD